MIDQYCQGLYEISFVKHFIRIVKNNALFGVMQNNLDLGYKNKYCAKTYEIFNLFVNN